MRLSPDRLAELHRLAILDSSDERAFDDITRLLAGTLAVPIALVNLLDAERDWFKSRVGIEMTQSPAVTSFCEAFFDTGAPIIVVEDTLTDTRFDHHPLVAGPPFIRFYAAARLVVNQQTVGTLCAYDLAPRALSAVQRDDLQLMAAAVVELLSQRKATLPPA